MRSKTNPVEESNRLLQQLNTVLVTGDCNGNSFNKTGEFDSVNLQFQNITDREPEESKQSRQSQGLRRESSTSDNYSQNINNEDFNDPAKTIGRVGEEHMRNVLFFLGFMAKFLQLVVASALLILAIEWEPLHDCIEKHVDKMFISFLILGLVCAGLLLVKFRGRFLVVLLINMLFMVNFFWYMAASSFHYLVFSPYWIVLCAVTQTAACLFLSVLVYFQKATYKGCGIYGYALVVPLLFFILSQPYYFWWYLKLAKGLVPETSVSVTVEDHSERELITGAPEDELSTTPASSPLALERTAVADHELIMSYPYYMINVCSGIGLAAIMTFEMVAWSQYSVKGLRFKTGTGILSGSFTALADDDDTEAANVPPVNL